MRSPRFPPQADVSPLPEAGDLGGGSDLQTRRSREDKTLKGGVGISLCNFVYKHLMFYLLVAFGVASTPRDLDCPIILP